MGEVEPDDAADGIGRRWGTDGVRGEMERRCEGLV